MKVYLLLILLICTTLQAQNHFQSPKNQIEYFKSNFKDLKDENSNLIDSLPPDLIFDGESLSNYFGISISTAGDLNGDGYSDFIARNYDGYQVLFSRDYVFKTYIYYGGINMDNIADVTIDYRTSSISSAGDVNGDGYSDIIISSTYSGLCTIYFGGLLMDNVADLTLTESEGINFGISVSTAGDVNGDGYSDVMVGADGDYDNNAFGNVYIYFGGEVMNNVADVILTGDIRRIHFGVSVSSAGDVNGDGYSDVIVGAEWYNTYTGRSYIFYGGSLMNNVADVIMTGNSDYSHFGHSVSSAGDVNGDGFSDVIVGGDWNNGQTGYTNIFYGGSPMNNEVDLSMTGETGNNRFGFSVSSAGDLNGDGYSDVIIGAWGYNNFKGRAYIFYGGNNMNNVADVILNGESEGNRFGYSVSLANDVNGDGYSDIIVGANGYNSYTGRVYLFRNFISGPTLRSPLNNSVHNLLNINFKWNKITSALYYVLIVSEDSIFTNIIVNDTIFIDTSKTISGFVMDKKYFWRLSVKDSSGSISNSFMWNFKTIPPLRVNINLIIEGLYSASFNQHIRKDSVTAYLRQSNPPFNIIDSAKTNIDSILFKGLFKFFNASTGIYYITVRHLNSIETWSKFGGEFFPNNVLIYNYDFTTTNTQAYGNNLKLKGSKYCLYSGDVNQDGYITLFDVIPINNDAANFVIGRFLPSDLTGDNIIDLTDVTLCYNNSTNFISKITP